MNLSHNEMGMMNTGMITIDGKPASFGRVEIDQKSIVDSNFNKSDDSPPTSINQMSQSSKKKCPSKGKNSFHNLPGVLLIKLK